MKTLAIIIIVLYVIFIVGKKWLFPSYSKWLTERAKRKFFKENPHLDPNKSNQEKNQ